MTNQQLMDHGNRMMDETDQAIDRAQKVVHETVNVGTETAAALKAQTEQMSRIVNELDSIHFSIKKASQLVKEIGRQVATDRCIMGLLFLIVIGVIAIIIVKVGRFLSFHVLSVSRKCFYHIHCNPKSECQHICFRCCIYHMTHKDVMPFVFIINIVW
nr:novel plant SNARE 11 [Ipomoea batatas]